MRSSLCTMVLAAGLAGCATDRFEPYAEMVGSPLERAALDESPVVFTGAGSQLRIRPTSVVRLEPGKQLVEARTLRTDSRIRNRRATIPIDAKPCTRYFVVARHPVGSHPEDWFIEFKGAAPIQECLVAAAGRPS